MERKCIHFFAALLLAVCTALMLPFPSYAQAQPVVTGLVVEKGTNGAMKGVTVTVKNSNRKTYTGDDGRYSIQAGADDILVFTFISMAPVEEKVNGRTVVNIAMETSHKVIPGPDPLIA